MTQIVTINQNDTIYPGSILDSTAHPRCSRCRLPIESDILIIRAFDTRHEHQFRYHPNCVNVICLDRPAPDDV